MKRMVLNQSSRILLLVCAVSLGLLSCSNDEDKGNADTEVSPVIVQATCLELTNPLPPKMADAPERVVVEPADEAAFLFDQNVLRTFELRITAENLAILDADPVAEQYVEGSLVYDGIEYGPVGIRYKGSLGAWVGCVEGSIDSNPFNVEGAKTCPKLNLKISFNEYDSEGRFFGLKKLQFHAMNMDDSMMRERLGYWLYRQMDVPAPRAVHVRVLINGVYAGVFLNVEYIDGRFTRSRFQDGEGNLYKEIWPSSPHPTALLTEDWIVSGLRTNEDESPSFDTLLQFNAQVMRPDGDVRAAAIQNTMNVDSVLRYVAVDRTIGADDGPFHFYCDGNYCDNHNFYVYEEQAHPRLWLIPWDLDNAFVVVRVNGMNSDTYLKVVYEWDDHNIDCTPQPGTPGLPIKNMQMPPSCDPLINALGCYFSDQYGEVIAELLNGPFSEAAVNEVLDQWQLQINDAVQEAAAVDPSQLSSADWQLGFVDLKERITILRANAR